MDTAKPDYTVSQHFEGQPAAVRQIYDRLLKALKRIGPVVEEPKKTSIHFVNTTALAGVATRKDYLILTIKSDRPLDSAHLQERADLSRALSPRGEAELARRRGPRADGVAEGGVRAERKVNLSDK